MAIRIVIIEDNPKFLEEVSLLLDDSPAIEVIGKYLTGKEGINGILEKNPDIALIDLKLPDISGIEVIKTVSGKECKTELLVLTFCDDDEHLFSAIKAGADGYILKNDGSELVKAIQDAVKGEAPMSFGLAKRIFNEFRETGKWTGNPKLQDLTKREAEILEYLAKGFTAKKVAGKLQISYEAVRTHLKHIYDKLQVHSAVEAVAVFHK